MADDLSMEVERICQAALEREPAERASFLAGACAGDEALRRDVESLLAHARGAEQFMDAGALAVAAQGLAADRAVAVGQRIGTYQVQSLLGVGGMGEVYRARDTKLLRDVALKVLPGSCAAEPHWLARFQREAQVLAALSHPNIGAIYGVEESSYVQALVLELVEGPTLADRIAQGPLPLDEAVRIATQIAEGLDAAHEHGVIHRDLKPANVKLRPDGVVKVLDFGLAKAVEPMAVGPTSLGQSPTITLTQAGMILGTAAYMSPEQARGHVADKRADIWAFGCVLYEMLTGRRPFEADDTGGLLASVLTSEPDWSALPSVVPTSLRTFLRRCLRKDPRERLRDIGDIRLALDGAVDAPAPAAHVEPASARTTWKRAIVWMPATALIGVAIAVGMVVGAAVWATRHVTPTEPQVVRFQMTAPPGASVINTSAAFSVSPDGHYVVFAAQNAAGGSSLWLRPLDSMAARPLPGTDDPTFTFWSPDSRSLAFAGRGRLMRLEIEGGGAPLVLADLRFVSNAVVPVTGTWSRDGIILFGSGDGIRRISASMGAVSSVTRVNAAEKEFGHAFPQFLPDGNRFLYFVISEDANVQGVYSSSLDHPERRKLIVRTSAKAVYVPARGSTPGYLLWMREDDLVAQRFDAERLEREGDPIRVAEGISRGPAPVFNLRAAYWASETGVLAHVHATDLRHRIVWIRRDGTSLGEALPEGFDIQPALSPDGTRLAVARGTEGGAFDIGVWEFSRSVYTPLTFENGVESTPVWSPDSKEIAYVVAGKGIYRTSATGAGQRELLLELGAAPTFLQHWSHDGKFLFYRTDEATGRRLWALPVPGAGGPAGAKSFLVARAPFDQFDQRVARLSPDGRWIALTSTESGRQEAYIQPFVRPGSGTAPSGRWRVSNAGGNDLAWRDDGKELYYESLTGDIMAVAMREDGQGLNVDAPRLLIRAGSASSFFHSFDATRDGQKFVVQLPPRTSGEDVALTVVTNWQAALRK